MPRALKWILAVLALVVVLIAGVAVALHSWVGSADFRTRAAEQASRAVGLPVTFDNLAVDMWPVPAIAVDRLAVRSQPPLTLERVEVRPTWVSVLHGHPHIATLLVRNAVVPQDAVGAIVAAFDKAHPKKPGDPGAGDAPPDLPSHVVFDKVTWVNAKGGRSVVDADMRLADDPWTIAIKVGGGTIKGTLRMQQGPKGERIPRGAFDTANVEVSELTAPSRTLTGKLEAHTELRGEMARMPDALHSETKFTVRAATVHGIDLAQAVKTVGMNRGGETRLDALAGQVVTDGKLVHLNNLVASSGALSANGAVTLSPDRHLGGQMTVSLTGVSAGGALGVPLVVGGTLDSPSVTLSRGALVGAAIGTVLAPGIGTGAGAGIGDKLGSGLKGLFGK